MGKVEWSRAALIMADQEAENRGMSACGWLSPFSLLLNLNSQIMNGAICTQGKTPINKAFLETSSQTHHKSLRGDFKPSQVDSED